MADNIQAIVDSRGQLRQDGLASFQIRISNFDGQPINPEVITVTVKNEAGTIAESSTTALDAVPPEKVADGFYAFDWIVATDQTTGKHTITWNYTIDGTAREEIQNIVIAENATDSTFYSGPRFILRNSLDQLIHCAQAIPVYNEQAKPTRDKKVYQFTKGLWNQTSSMRIYRNERILTVADDLEIDYNDGIVTFTDTQLTQDTITADYNFRWFSDDQLDQFIDSGINKLNSFPPFSPIFNLTTVVTSGQQWLPVVLYGAATDAIRTLMMCLQFQEPAQYFGGLDRAQQAFGNFETLKQNYEKLWETLLGNKKFGPYPEGRLVVVPEFTLPGGRSRWFRYLFSGGS